MAKAESRNYQREAANETPKRKEARRKRKRARYALEVAGKVSRNDGKVVGHKKTLKSNGSNSKSNLRVESKQASDKQGGTVGSPSLKGKRGKKLAAKRRRG